MNRKIIIIILLVVVVAAVLWLMGGNEAVAPTPTPFASPALSPTASPDGTNVFSPTPAPQSHVVAYTDSGYSPASLTIKRGDTVVWRNNSSRGMWTASAIHPTHKIYPGTDIAKCEDQADGSMFDACANLSSGQSWSFIFDHGGTWRYHNHTFSAHTGTIIVE